MHANVPWPGVSYLLAGGDEFRLGTPDTDVNARTLIGLVDLQLHCMGILHYAQVGALVQHGLNIPGPGGTAPTQSCVGLQERYGVSSP